MKKVTRKTLIEDIIDTYEWESAKNRISKRPDLKKTNGELNRMSRGDLQLLLATLIGL